MGHPGHVTGYCHPVFQPFADDSPPELLFTRPHTIECRELVADAALGLVDSFDVASNGDNLGAAVVYRRLLGAGIRLAATAGTDVMLNLPRFHIHSNPPGWARVYAELDGDLSTDGLTGAIRAGRTIATNGPWIDLDVDGHGPGARIDAAPRTRRRVRATAHGPGLRRLRLYTADGLLAEGLADAGDDPDRHPSVAVTADITVDEPTFVAAQADGAGHPEVLQATAFAHTSPVYLDVHGQAVTRATHVRWCLRWLDALEALCRRHGVFHTDAHRNDMNDILDRARQVYTTVAASA